MMSTISSDYPSRRYEVIPSIESIFDLDHDRYDDVNNQVPEVFLHNQLKFNLNIPTKIENLTTSCKDPTSIVISNPAKMNSDPRSKKSKTVNFNILDNEELDLAQRFAKQDLNRSRSDFTTQTNTIVNKNHVSNKKKVKREQPQTALQIKKIKKPQNVSYEAKISSSKGPSQRHKEVSNYRAYNKIDSPADNLMWIQTKSSNSHIVKKERASASKSKMDPIPIRYKDKDSLIIRKMNEIERLRSEVRKFVLQIRELHHSVFEKEADTSLLSSKSVTNSDKYIVKLSNRSIRILYVVQKKIRSASSRLLKGLEVNQQRFKEILTHIAVCYRGLIQILEEFNRDIARRLHKAEVEITLKVYKDLGNLINMINQCCSSLKIASIDDTSEILLDLYNDAMERYALNEEKNIYQDFEAEVNIKPKRIREIRTLNQSNQTRNTSKSVIWINNSRKASKISDNYIGRNQEPQFLNDTQSSRLKISDKRKLRNIGIDSDATQKIADDPHIDGEVTLTPPESPTKQSLLPWKVTSRSATPRNDYPPESIESPQLPTSPHNQNFIFDRKKSNSSGTYVIDDHHQTSKLRKSPRRQKVVNVKTDSIKNRISNELISRNNRLSTSEVSTHGDEITETLLKYLIRDTVDELQRIEFGEEMKHQVNDFLASTNIDKVLQLIENIEVQETGIRRTLNEIQYADTNDIAANQSHPHIPNQNPIVITGPSFGQLSFTNTHKTLDDHCEMLTDSNGFTQIQHHSNINLSSKRVIATTRNAMDRIEQYCDQYKEYLSKVPQVLSGTLTGVWKFERICDKLLDKLLENVGKEMEKSIDSYVENLYAAEFEA